MQNSLNDQMDTLFKPSNVQTLEETVDDFKEIGTGVLTGTIAIPSDVVTGAETVNTFLAENSYSPMAMLIKENLQEFEKEYGREAFDQGFEEITGIKSDPTNINQLMGEILSPTGVFLAPIKLADKLSDGASVLYNKIKNTLSANNFGKSDLVTEGAYIDPVMTIPKKDIDVNRPKIDLNVIGENNPLGKEQAQKYRIAEYGELKTGTAKRGQKPVKSSVFTFNIKEEDSIKNYEMLTLPQKQTLYKATGVYRGADGKLRYAIPMKDATLNTDAFKVGNDGNLIIPEGATLKDILNFQDLFKQYDKRMTIDVDGVSKIYKPIGDIKIVRVPKNEMHELQATYNPNTDEIGLSPNTSKGMLSDIIHELQHAIQRREGFDSGSSVSRETLKLDPDYDLKVDNLKKSLGGIQSEFFEKVNNRNKNVIDVLKFNLTQNELLKSSEPQFVNELMKTFGSKGMDEMFQEKFENMITKLAQKEQINYNKFDGDINFNVSSDETYHTTLSNNPLQIAMSNKINFDKAEANTIRLLSGMPEFKPYMKKRIELLNETDKLNETYKQAEKNYRSSRGEVEAFFAQKRLEDSNEVPSLGQFYKGEKQIPKKLELDVEQSVNPSSIKNLSPITQEIIFLDNPNTVKSLFLKDTERAKELGGEIVNQDYRAPKFKTITNELADPISLDKLNKAKKEIYDMTQFRYKDLPEEITVYRVGKLNQEDGVSSFSLDPNYNVELNLPWQKGRDDPLVAYKVKKSDILASPDFAEGIGKGRKFEEEEVIIDNDKVKIEE